MTLQLSRPLVNTEWLHEQLSQPELRVLDCTQVMEMLPDGSFGFVPAQSEWQEAHIPGSIYVDILADFSEMQGQSPMMPAPARLAEAMQAVGVGNDTAVVLYDRGNHAWAARMWWMLQVCGFDNVGVLNGGWQKWQAEGLPESSESSTYPPAQTFDYEFRPELIASKEQVTAALDDASVHLLNSLTLPMFTGEVSPYSRAGRIPGSKHLFCESLLDGEKKCYLSEADLKDLVGKAGLNSGDKIIPYCGGGIAASSNALILAELGFTNVALYDGSLAEWASDPDLPMETG